MRKLLIFIIVLIPIILLIYFLTKSNRVNNIKQESDKEINLKSDMKITSSAFEHNQNIPNKYTCDGENINPPLQFIDVPQNAKSLALIVDDPDAPSGTFDHWIVYNIDPATLEIKENSIPNSGSVGKSSTGVSKWVSPCPPSGVHRYFFKLYALDTRLNLPTNVSKKEVEEAMKNHVIESSELIGLYNRNK